MPWPPEYQRASVDFEKFMVAARDHAGLATTNMAWNMAWNMVVGVLHTFRKRLTIHQALRFAAILPPVIRAIFVEDWDPDEPVLEFASDAKLLEEARAVRREHNFSPPNAISAVSAALRRHVDQEAFEEMLSQLPAGAKHYWQVTESAA